MIFSCKLPVMLENTYLMVLFDKTGQIRFKSLKKVKVSPFQGVKNSENTLKLVKTYVFCSEKVAVEPENSYSLCFVLWVECSNLCFKLSNVQILRKLESNCLTVFFSLS